MDERYEEYYGISKNGNIKCLGIRLKNGDIASIPVYIEGNNKGRNDNNKLVGEYVVFYNKKTDKYYDIKILEYVKDRKFKFLIEYKGVTKYIQCNDFIVGCNIGDIIKEKSNQFYKEDDYWIMTINIKDTINGKCFNNNYIKVKFNGNDNIIKNIKNTTWCIRRVTKTNKFYIQTSNYNKKGIRTQLHNVIFEKIKKGNMIDHINGDTFDNRLCNLREVTPRDNTKNKKGSGFPLRKNNGWYYMVTIEGYKTSTPIRAKYKQADIDALIIQQEFEFKHRESEYWKLEGVDDEYKKNIICLINNKINRYKNKVYGFTGNEFDIITLEGREIIKVYGKNKKSFMLLSKEDSKVLKSGRIHSSHGYWSIGIDKKKLLVHRYILGITETNIYDIHVDHLNKNTSDNTRENLVITTKVGNFSNKNSRGYIFTGTSYKIHYSCYWEQVCDHKSINKIKQCSFGSELEAQKEVYKRKYLANYLRPKFKHYQEYIDFKSECMNDDIDKYWIEKMFPDINKIIIPDFLEVKGGEIIG